MKFLQEAHPDNVSIIDMLHKALTIVDPPRPWHGVPHASELTNSNRFCPRELVLSHHLNKKTYPRKIEAPMKITFDEGKDKQARFNNEWLVDRMVGTWECRHCQNMLPWGKKPKWCSCSHPDWRYREMVFMYPGAGITGSIDAILDVGKPKLRAVEFKIMDKDLWIDLKAPLAEHRVRSKLYLEILEADPTVAHLQIDTSRIHVIYCMRGFGKKDALKGRISPFKEYIVHKDSVEADFYVRMGVAVKRSKDLGWSYFPSGICSTMFDKRCQSCTVPKECFSGKYPADFTWQVQD